MDLTPITLREANAFVAAHHRHHGPARGCIACVAVSEGETVRGVAIVGRPLARMLDDGFTAEVVRVATDGGTAPHVHRWRLLPGLAWRCACGAVRLALRG